MADNYGDENKNVNQGWITTLTIKRLPLAEKTLPYKFWFGKNQMFAEVPLKVKGMYIAVSISDRIRYNINT